MSQIVGAFFRKELNLSSKLWHRLVTVIFIGMTLAVVTLSSFWFYEKEAQRATHYTILKTLRDYNHEVKTREQSLRARRELDFRVVVFDSFLSEEDLAGFLGCAQADGTVEWISEFETKDKIDCESTNSTECYVPKAICKGDASRIVKYTAFVQYTAKNYFRIAAKVLLTTFVWLGASLTLYYKGLIYVIYGNSSRTQAMNNG